MSLLDKRPYTFDRVVRIGLTVGLAYVGFLLLDYLKGVLIPFAVALLIAYLMDPLVRFYQYKARLKSRILSIVASLISVGVVLTGIILLTAPSIMRNVSHAGKLFAKLAEDQDLSEQLQQWIPPNLYQDLQEGLDNTDLPDLLQSERLSELATEALQRILPEVWGVFSGALNVIIGVLGIGVILLYLVFILLDFEKITQGWTAYVPQRYLPRIEAMVSDFSDAMSNYFRAQSLIAFSVGVLFAIGFSIIGLPLAITFGLFVGLLNMVPYLQNVALIPAAFLAFIQAADSGQSYWVMILLVIAVFVVVQSIQDFFLTPRIMGKTTGLNPAMILLSLSVWGQLLGILGLIIALPMTFLLLSYYRKFLTATNELPLEPAMEPPPPSGE